jgi:hypothetical protein
MHTKDEVLANERALEGGLRVALELFVVYGMKYPSYCVCAKALVMITSPLFRIANEYERVVDDDEDVLLSKTYNIVICAQTYARSSARAPSMTCTHLKVVEYHAKPMAMTHPAMIWYLYLVV